MEIVWTCQADEDTDKAPDYQLYCTGDQESNLAALMI